MNKLNLNNIEPKVLGNSQKGQDAFIDYIFKQIGTTNKFYVEFGGHDGYSMCNTLHLKNNLGWSGILIDCDYENHEINLYKEFLTTNNICSIFEKLNIPKSFDFLCIDVDGNDYWFLKKLLENNYRPRVIMIETNVRFDPDVSIVRNYSENWKWDNREWYGASPLAIKKMSESFDYCLIHIHLDDAFLIRNDLLCEEDKDISWESIYPHKNIELYELHDIDGPRGIRPGEWSET